MRGEPGGLSREFVRRVGKGDNTKFWSDWWEGEMPLKDKFRRLYKISTQQESNIEELGRWERVEWLWQFS